MKSLYLYIGLKRIILEYNMLAEAWLGYADEPHNYLKASKAWYLSGEN